MRDEENEEAQEQEWGQDGDGDDNGEEEEGWDEWPASDEEEDLPDVVKEAMAQ